MLKIASKTEKTVNPIMHFSLPNTTRKCNSCNLIPVALIIRNQYILLASPRIHNEEIIQFTIIVTFTTINR